MGDRELVKLLLAHNVNPATAISRSQTTALAVAIKAGHVDVVKALIDADIDVNADATGGLPPLHYALTCRKNDIARLLVAAGAFVNLKGGEHKTTPLHHAAVTGNLEMVKFLISKRAKTTTTTTLGDNLVHLAAYAGSKECVELLIAQGCKVDLASEYGWAPLHYAAHNGHTAVMEVLIAKGADLDAKADRGLTPLHEAAQQGHSGAVALLAAKGANVKLTNRGKLTPLQYMVTEWLPPGTKRKYVLSDPLLYGSRLTGRIATVLPPNDEGRRQIVRVLLDAGADAKALVNAKDNRVVVDRTFENCEEPLLNLLARRGALDCCKLAVANKADVKGTDRYKQTPLHGAARMGRAEVVAFLLEKGAEVNATDVNGTTPLHAALQGPYRQPAAPEKEEVRKVTDLLLSKGADVSAKDNAGRTPLHWAARMGRAEVVTFLLEKGAEVNAKDVGGATPLHGALQGPHFWSPKATEGDLRKVIDLLLAKGADINAKDNAGKTPLRYSGRKHRADYLRSKGAEE